MIAAPLLAAALSGGPGVAIQADPVCISHAVPGRAYGPAQVYVQDSGTGPETVVMGTFPVRGQLPLPPSWLSYGYPSSWWGLVRHHDLGLQPGGSGLIGVTVTIPAGARRGQYVVELWAHTVAPAGRSGMTAATGAGGAVPLAVGVGEAARCPSATAAARPVRGAEYVPAQDAGTSRWRISSQAETRAGEAASVLLLIAVVYSVMRRPASR